MIENLFGGGGGGGTVDTITAGTGISVDSTDPANPIVSSTVVDTNDKAKVSSNDTTAGFLNGKLVAGSGIALTENNNGGDETLGIAVSNLGASAITTGTIATARLGTGTANSSTYLAGDQTYKAAVTSVNGSTGAVTVGDTTYTTTIADAENTTSQITLAQFTVPANTWADGQVIHLDLVTTADNNTGSSRNITFVVGGTTIADWTSLNLSYGSGFGVKRNFTKLRFARVGNGVYYEFFNSPNSTTISHGPNPPFHGGGDGFNPQSDTAVTFTSDITIYLKIQFNFASASLYCRVENARAYKVSAGTV